MTLTGTIVDPLTGAGARGVKIDLSATDAGGHTAEASTTTDATGVWQATVDLETSGGASATVTVASPKGSTYATTFGVNASTGVSRNKRNGTGFNCTAISVRRAASRLPVRR